MVSRISLVTPCGYASCLRNILIKEEQGKEYKYKENRLKICAGIIKIKSLKVSEVEVTHRRALRLLELLMEPKRIVNLTSI